MYFQTKGAEIQKRELVIAIWDDETGKSHDDFMEGVSALILIKLLTNFCRYVSKWVNLPTLKNLARVLQLNSNARKRMDM